MPSPHQAHFRSGAAQPIEFGRIILNAGLVEQRQRRKPARKDADRRAVFRCDIVEVICGAQTARAGHVFDDDGRMTGKVVADMAADEPCVGVKCRADRGPDGDPQLAELIGIIRHRICMWRALRASAV